MIAMQMADENVIYFVDGYLVSHQLHLSTLTTVDQEMPVLNTQVLRSWKSTECWQRPT
jgi:pantothenate kinase-related protein Tda10